MRLLPLLIAVAACASAGEILLPSNALERSGSVHAVYRSGALASGQGVFSVEWTDSAGRIVVKKELPVSLTGENEIRFPLPLYRAVTMKNHLHVHFSFHGVNRKGEPDNREEEAARDFVAKPAPGRWSDYAILMWQNHSISEYAALKAAGINGGQYGDRNSAGVPDFLLDNNLRWYVENIATDFYSEYHRYFGDRPNHWRFLEAQEAHRKEPASKEPFKRHPSLSDKVWLDKICERVAEAVRIYSPYRPLFYNLGDESGIADLASAWDFDFSDQSLEGMRAWLKDRYGNLAALNGQWGSQFSDWNAVMPETTDEAMKRTDENYSSWSDFKEWMDIAYAGALQAGANAVHSIDPAAYVAIEGGQMPGWGGYDYSRIVKVVDAIEPYDIGNNIEIIRSLKPSMAVVTTSFQNGPREKHRVWYELLHGNSGLIIWDEKPVFVDPDGTLGPRGQEVAPYYNELRSGIAAQIMNSHRFSDPIAIHYSQPSMRAEWMLAQRPKGPKWAERRSSIESEDSDFLWLRESYCKLIEDLGLQYRFVSYDQVEHGELAAGGYKVLILPRSSALSEREATNIRDFGARGGTVIADGQPGVFDEHVRHLAKPRLAELSRIIRLDTSGLDYHNLRRSGKETAIRDRFQRLLAEAGVRPRIAVADASGKPVTGVEVHTFQNGGVTLLALLSNPDQHVDDNAPPDPQRNERFERPVPLKITLPFAASIYDIRASAVLGKKREINVTLQPYEPIVLSLAATELPKLALSVSPRAARGNDVYIGIAPASESPANIHAIHIDVIDPAGKVIDYYSGNLLADGGRCAKLVPLAVNDAPGQWTVRARDLLSGQVMTANFQVN